MLNNTHWDALIPHNDLLNGIHDFYWIVGLVLIFFTFFSIVFREQLFVSEALLATVVGIVVGPDVLKVFTPEDWFGAHDEIVLWEISRLVISFQCLLVGINLPNNYRSFLVTDMMFMVGPVMLCMWIISSIGIHLILGFTWPDSFILGACITPTDPILASAIVSGKFSEKHLAPAVRSLIMAESGLNDGVGLLFLWIPFYISRVAPTSEAVGWIFVKVFLYQIVLSIVVGLSIGLFFRWSLKKAVSKNFIDSSYFPLICVALLFGTVGMLTRLGVDDLLGCFFVGYALSYDEWFLNNLGGPHVFEMVDSFINMIYFFVLGALLPWTKFYEIGLVKLICLSAFVLAFRRLPAVMAFWKFVPSLKTRKDAFLTGWFGPIGAGACFYATFAYDLGAHDDLVVSALFIVFSSIIVHGASVFYLDYLLDEPASINTIDEHEGDLPLCESLTLTEAGEAMEEGDLPLCESLTLTDENSNTCGRVVMVPSKFLK
ncbi:hypothetical protein HDV02_004157 [Globomyces sp. JEL0801]|nr:hypothetical protein HDV02_004157 [Globomyces sp. JEL0801]